LIIYRRAELRLTDLDRVIATRCLRSRTTRERRSAAVMFFKDLTRVEQLEERERLRDRLASLGEMAGIATNSRTRSPASSDGGLLRRQVPDSKDAQSLLADILSEAKLANAIVVGCSVRPSGAAAGRAH